MTAGSGTPGPGKPSQGTGASGSGPGSGSASGLVLMGLLAVWSLLLAGGFLVAATQTWDGFASLRAVAYGLLGVFLLLLAVRTGYELVRRLRGRGDGAPGG